MRKILALLFVLLSSNVLAWSDHASLLWPLLRTMPQMLEPTLEVESLAEFLDAEAEGLEVLLADHERWSRENLPHYAPRPDKLAFDADNTQRQIAFLRAIRVNPTLSYPLYRQTTVEDRIDTGAELLVFSNMSFLKGGVSHESIVYLPAQAGAALTPAHVVASGSDEPDFGMDIGLFEDNDTPFGREYGFGEQPFGNPNLDYSSQAPFHMGFYHLDWLSRTLQPALLQTYPEWRVSLYRELARFAFATGHDYWGWRFTGWGLHYVGDLTQPYHAQPLPGVSTFEALWGLVKGEVEAAVQLVSNRHGVLESYQYQRVQRALNAQAWDGSLLDAIASGAPVPTFDTDTVRGALTAESVEAGAALDAALERYMPERFVSDPGFEWNGSAEESTIVDSVEAAGGSEAVAAMDAVIAGEMRRFSRYARAWINAALASADQQTTTANSH